MNKVSKYVEYVRRTRNTLDALENLLLKMSEDAEHRDTLRKIKKHYETEQYWLIKMRDAYMEGFKDALEETKDEPKM